MQVADEDCNTFSMRIGVLLWIVQKSLNARKRYRPHLRINSIFFEISGSIMISICYLRLAINHESLFLILEFVLVISMGFKRISLEHPDLLRAYEWAKI